jgi:hypothetical protein
VDQFIKGVEKQKVNTFIDRREAFRLEKGLRMKSLYSKNAKEKEISKKWQKILRDPKIFKK